AVITGGITYLDGRLATGRDNVAVDDQLGNFSCAAHLKICDIGFRDGRGTRHREVSGRNGAGHIEAGEGWITLQVVGCVVTIVDPEINNTCGTVEVFHGDADGGTRGCGFHCVTWLG